MITLMFIFMAGILYIFIQFIFVVICGIAKMLGFLCLAGVAEHMNKKGKTKEVESI